MVIAYIVDLTGRSTRNNKLFYLLKLWSLLTVLFTCINRNLGSDDLKSYYMSYLCGEQINLDFEMLKAGKINFQGISGPQDSSCTLEIKPTVRFNRIAFHFEDVVIHGGCITIGQGTMQRYTNISGSHGTFCEKNLPRYDQINITDAGESLILKYTKIRKNEYLYTSLHLQFNLFFTDGSCKDEYECDNGRCIPEKINCNGHNPCGDNSDCRSTGLSSGKVAGIIVGIVVFIGLWICCIMNRNRFNDNTPENSDDYRDSWNDEDEDEQMDTPVNRRREIIPEVTARNIVPSAPLIFAPPAYAHLSRSMHNLHPNDGQIYYNNGSRSHNGVNRSSSDIYNNGSRPQNQNEENGPPLDLPPSYNDVMAREDIYKVKSTSKSADDVRV